MLTYFAAKFDCGGCLNKGVCVSQDVCECASGYEGPHCEFGKYLQFDTYQIRRFKFENVKVSELVKMRKNIIQIS